MAGCKRAAAAAELAAAEEELSSVSTTTLKANIDKQEEYQKNGNSGTPNKKSKEETEGEGHQQKFKDLSGFKLKGVLSNSADTKRLTVQGTFPDGQQAVVILDKKPFTEENFEELFSGESKLEQIFQNDIYGNYDCLPGVKAAGKFRN